MWDDHDDECAEDITNTGACRHGHAFRVPAEGCGRPGCTIEDHEEGR